MFEIKYQPFWTGICKSYWTAGVLVCFSELSKPTITRTIPGCNDMAHAGQCCTS